MPQVQTRRAFRAANAQRWHRAGIAAATTDRERLRLACEYMHAACHRAERHVPPEQLQKIMRDMVDELAWRADQVLNLVAKSRSLSSGSGSGHD